MISVVKAFLGNHSFSIKAILLAAAVAAIGWMYLSNKILTLERDTAVAAAKVAEQAKEASERLRIVQIEALEKVSRENHDRQKFITENTRAIEKGRANGDGPLAPVLRDTAERLLARQRAKAASAGDP